MSQKLSERAEKGKSMAGPLRMPNEDEVPPGPHRDFLEFLFRHYGWAGRPTLEDISDRVRSLESAGTASKETIRRVLRGTTLSRWKNIDAIFGALCSIAELHPDNDFRYHSREGAVWTQPRRDVLQSLWNNAVDPPTPEPPQSVGRVIVSERRRTASVDPI